MKLQDIIEIAGRVAVLLRIAREFNLNVGGELAERVLLIIEKVALAVQQGGDIKERVAEELAFLTKEIQAVEKQIEAKGGAQALQFAFDKLNARADIAVIRIRQAAEARK